MRSLTPINRRARRLRLIVGSLLLLAGTCLLVVQGLAWFDLEPCGLRTLEQGTACTLG
ncbi:MULTISPECIES: hypothetical protein [Pseudomonas]|uniref:hypothetical protein n=1 Tax=Pseudomonas TaxID=286 RepID=UPI000B2D05A7